MKIGADLKENEQAFKNIFQHCSDVKFREVTINDQPRLLMIYTDGLVDTDIILSHVLKPLLYKGLPKGLGAMDSLAQMFDQELLPVLETMKLSDTTAIAELIIKGHLCLLIDGEPNALIADIQRFETRNIEEPTEETTLRGSKESFTENLRTNTAMIRRILGTPKLKMESYTIGSLTQTEIVITYIEGKVAMEVLNTVRDRIGKIEMEGILESGYIEESIEDFHFTPFQQLGNTERPDVVAAGLLEGKVAIITNGSPFVLIAPVTFWGGLQAPDDYYERFLFVDFSRWIRFAFILFSVLFPSLYIALTNYHQEMVPLKLMTTIAMLREKSPFPTVIEVLLMELMFEGLREAGIRLPSQIGPLVTVAGALVIGEAAVRAGIISAPIVIVVAAAGIASFVIPRYRAGYPLRMLRFPLLILSGLFGLFGMAAGIIAILIHMIHLSSFGTPFFSPVAPLASRRLKDILVRRPRKLVRKSDPEAEPT
ncbi:spore germination protein KA [Paenibacillus sp. UNC496MF]|uniref:spore germination protein n=1 Tax=Paenibacillus sp. UNC496MF TaxID=1502753 RepID=UPI0008E53FBB|nr:spore germination protein [Paenibacillus sp. UNC496MF]SFJ33071.1 spore germination protein KA [Paenibacillus sp. UNC496MF]